MRQSEYVTKALDADRAARVVINALKRAGLSTFSIEVDIDEGFIDIGLKRSDVLAEADPVTEHMAFVDTGDGEQVTLAAKTKSGLDALKTKVIKVKQGEETVEL